MDDLATFLLARIAEDQATAESLYHFTVEESIYYSCPATRTAEDAGDLEYGEDACDCGMPSRRARALAECDAKRRVVRACAAADTPLGDEVLRVLGLPYADHPDYRPEWKPS